MTVPYWWPRMKPTTLVDEFEHYSSWRDAVYVRVEALRDWLIARSWAMPNPRCD